MLVEAVKGVDVFYPVQHIGPALRAARKHIVNVKETYQSISVLDNILMQFTRAIKRAKTSAWLAVLLLVTCHSELALARFILRWFGGSQYA